MHISTCTESTANYVAVNEKPLIDLKLEARDSGVFNASSVFYSVRPLIPHRMVVLSCCTATPL